MIEVYSIRNGTLANARKITNNGPNYTILALSAQTGYDKSKCSNIKVLNVEKST